MSKYIIEIPDNTRRIWIDVFGEGYCYTRAENVDDLEELNSDYINEHYGELQDEAYQRGINDGSLDVKQRVEGAYQRGLEYAWETARKLFSSMPDSDIEKAFPIEWNNGGFNALMNLKPQQAIEKLKAYEDKQKDSIEVGDEVVTRGVVPDNTFLVTKVTESTVYGISNDGSWNFFNRDSVTKTGKHYDIQSILEAMRE